MRVRVEEVRSSSDGVEAKAVSRDGGLPQSQVETAAASEIDDKLTTLPLPGDGPNPLALLVEVSSHAARNELHGSDQVDAESRALGRSLTDPGDAYYTPIQRLPKFEAPRMLSLISEQE